MALLTVAAIEAELLVRLGPYLAKVGLDGTTADGTNRSLQGPIRSGVLAIGRTPTDPLAAADLDIATVAGFELEKLLDAAELKALEICWGNWAEHDEGAGSENQSMSQLGDRLERRIAALREKLLEPYVPIDAAGRIPGPSAVATITAGRWYARAAFPPPRGGRRWPLR